MSEMQYRAALAILFARMSEIGAAGETYVASALAHCVTHSGGRHEMLQEIAKHSFKSALKTEAQHGFLVNVIASGPMRRKGQQVWSSPPTTKAYVQLIEDLKRTCLPLYGTRGNSELSYARLSIEISPNLIEHFFNVHGPEILYSRVEMPAFQGKVAVTRIARCVAESARIFMPSPANEISTKLIADFFSRILAKPEIFADKAYSKTHAREINATLEQLIGMPASFVAAHTARQGDIFAAFALTLAILSQMEFSMKIGIEDKQKDTLLQLARRKKILRQYCTAPKSSHMQALEAWCSSDV